MNFPFYEQAPKEAVSSCNLCGGHVVRPWKQKDRYGLNAPSVQCKACGLIFLSYRMTPQAYAEFYRDGHYRKLLGKYLQKPVTLQSIESDQTRYAERISEALAQFMDPYRGGLLLDIGGSAGVVADRMAHDYNLDASVIEPSESEAGRAQDKGLTVYTMPTEQFSPNGTRYDVALLCRSVDHLLDIKGDLKRIRGWVRPGGLFFVDFVADPAIKIDHPYYLTLKTMGQYLIETGFLIKKWSPWLDSRHISVVAEAV